MRYRSENNYYENTLYDIALNIEDGQYKTKTILFPRRRHGEKPSATGAIDEAETNDEAPRRPTPPDRGGARRPREGRGERFVSTASVYVHLTRWTRRRLR